VADAAVTRSVSVLLSASNLVPEPVVELRAVAYSRTRALPRPNLWLGRIQSPRPLRGVRAAIRHLKTASTCVRPRPRRNRFRLADVDPEISSVGDCLDRHAWRQSGSSSQRSRPDSVTATEVTLFASSACFSSARVRDTDARPLTQNPLPGPTAGLRGSARARPARPQHIDSSRSTGLAAKSTERSRRPSAAKCAIGFDHRAAIEQRLILPRTILTVRCLA